MFLPNLSLQNLNQLLFLKMDTIQFAICYQLLKIKKR